MARITVEDCLEHVDNRFQLVLIATKRARQIEQGKQPLLDFENDKPTVVALREIAAGLVDVSILNEKDREPPEAEFEAAAPAPLDVDMAADVDTDADADEEPESDGDAGETPAGDAGPSEGAAEAD